MFDPERDEDSGARPFYLRLAVVAAITAAAGLVLWPSVTGFSAGLDQQKGCLAITDGWHADHSLSAADKAAESMSVGLHPSSQQLQEIERASARLDWVRGPGACVPESRHRLIRSGIGLVGLFGFVGGVAIVRRTRTNLHRVPAKLAGT